MSRKVCEPPWIKLYWHEMEDFADLTDEQMLKVCREAQNFFKRATRANGDESKLKELAGSFDIESNPLLSAFIRTISQANEQRERNRENVKKRWEKNGIPNAEPVPMVDGAEPTGCDDGIAPAPIDAEYNPLGLKNPHGTYGKLFFTRDEMDVFASVASSVKNPTAVVQSAINEISKSIKLRGLHISESDRVDAVDRITKRIRYVSGQKNELAVAQAKLDTANVYKAAQDAKPKMFQ